MSVLDAVKKHVKEEVVRSYKVEQVWDVPSTGDTSFGATGSLVETAFLYADLRQSSLLSIEHRRTTAAKLYRCFHLGVVMVARHFGGQVRSFDGDRVMIIFPPRKGDPGFVCAQAVSAAFAIVHCIHDVVSPPLLKYEELDFGIGIDYGKVMAIRVGVRGDPDNNATVWVGRPANFAAKLSDRGKYPNHLAVSDEVYSRLPAELRQKEEPILGGLFKSTTRYWSRTGMKFANSDEMIWLTSHEDAGLSA